MAYDKVIDSAALDAGMTAVADAIRAKAGTTEPLAWPDGFSEAIAGIESTIIEPAFRATVTVDEEKTESVSNLFVIESTFAADLNLENNSSNNVFSLSSKRQRILVMITRAKSMLSKLNSVIANVGITMFYVNDGKYYCRATASYSLRINDAENKTCQTVTSAYGLSVDSITETSVNLKYTHGAYSTQLEVGDYEVLIYDLGGIDFAS